jgi:hypothetical protein
MLKGWLGNGGDAELHDLGLSGDVLLSRTRAEEREAVARAFRLVDRFLDRVAGG